MGATGPRRRCGLGAAWALLVLTTAGCRLTGLRSDDAARADGHLAGLRAITADAFGIHLRRDPESNWLLWADGRFTNHATVHPGQTFLLRHGSGLRRWYRVVGLEQDQLSLIEVEERPLPRGEAQSRRVIHVKPYDLDQPRRSGPVDGDRVP